MSPTIKERVRFEMFTKAMTANLLSHEFFQKGYWRLVLRPVYEALPFDEVSGQLQDDCGGGPIHHPRGDWPRVVKHYE